SMSLLYSEANDERLPPERWMDGLTTFGKATFGKDEPTEEFFTCPDVLVRDKLKLGFAMNSAVVAMPLKSVGDPTKVVLYFECDAVARNVVANTAARTFSRHRGRSNHVFLDGHWGKVMSP
ncbi:MAG: hypothetical protein ABL962_16915, partial [Fimbriimonadaceae bacterium]